MSMLYHKGVFMVKFRFSAFSDEYSPVLDEQIEGLLLNKVRMMEVRGVDGVNVSDLSAAQVKEVRRKLDAVGIGVSAVGSPIGKIKITDPMEPHLEKLKNTCEVAGVLGTGRIRMFSFYIPDGDFDGTKNEVIDRIGAMLDVADGYGIRLCHENEKGIWGDLPQRCRELMEGFSGRLGCVFDPANFIQCGVEPFEHAYRLLRPYMDYMHIKDALKSGTIVPAGMGIGGIPEILAMLARTWDGECILTLEPHLRVFAGLEKLENGAVHSNIGTTYGTAAEAFGAAVTNLTYCIPRTAERL